MNKIESQKSDYPSMQGYMEQEEIKKMATCPSTHDEHDLYAAAHCLVSERVDKFDLIDMVYAILKREHSEKSKYTLPVMEWTDDPQLGAWNWWKDGDSRIPRYVYQDGTVAITMQIDRVPYQKLGGQWAGPIPEPRPHEPVGEQEKNNVWFQAV